MGGDYVLSYLIRDGEILGHWLALPGMDKVSKKSLTQAAPKVASLPSSGDQLMPRGHIEKQENETAGHQRPV